MSMLGELNELLKQIPVWRELVTLPARVRALEERLGVAGAIPVDDRATCRYCRTGKLDVKNSRPDPVFGDVGIKLETLQCDGCGKTDERQFDPLQRR